MLRSALGNLADQLLQSSSTTSLYEDAAAFVMGLGFNSMMLAAEADSIHLATTPPIVVRWPDGAWETYLREGHDSRNYIHAKFAGSPFGTSWRSDEAVADREHAYFLGYLNDFGVRSGVVAPVIAGGGKQRIIVATSERREIVDPVLAACVTAVGSLIVMAEARLRAGAVQGAALARLSRQQAEILQWVSRGKSNADIAAITGVPVRTVNYHVSEILRKLDVTSRAQAASILASRPVPANFPAA